MIVRAKAPLRLSFAGGGTDISPYCDEHGGAVLNTTINRYAYATLKPSSKYTIHSVEYNRTVSYDLDEEFVYDGQMGLVSGVLDHFRQKGLLNGGVEVNLHNDAPPGSGLGSSSAIVVAMIAAIDKYLHLALTNYQMADLAYHIERIDVGQKGGRQDQYAAVFGGFSFMEFHADKAVVHPLRLDDSALCELEYRLICAYVGGSRFSSSIIQKHTDNYRQGLKTSIEAMHEIKRLCYAMRDALLTADFGELGALINRSWHAKKQMAEGITTSQIDLIYEAARNAGAMGGKVVGAGGGGFMFFLCDPTRRIAIQTTLKEMGCQLADFSLSGRGVHAWTAPQGE